MESFFTGTPISDVTRIGAGARVERHRIVDRARRVVVRDEGGRSDVLAAARHADARRPPTGTMVYPTVFYFPTAAVGGPGGAITIRSGEERGGDRLQVHPVSGVRVSGTLLAT